jgi:putative SOS response-associated peptidase YedK
MCEKFVLASELQRIEPRFNALIGPNTAEIPKHFAVSGGDRTYVITNQDPHLIQVFTFGMTPFYANEPMNLINARAEGDKNGADNPDYNGSKAIFLNQAFRKPIQSQSYLVIADAYYEWSDQNKPYLVYLQNKNRPFAFAGLYDQWQQPESGEIIYPFTIITTTANELLQSIGVIRMPVILSRSNEKDWLKASNPLSEALRVLVAYPYDRMNAYPVSENVNWKCNNDPSMLNPIGERLLKERNQAPVLMGRKFHKDKPHSDKPWFQSQPQSGERKE